MDQPKNNLGHLLEAELVYKYLTPSSKRERPTSLQLPQRREPNLTYTELQTNWYSRLELLKVMETFHQIKKEYSMYRVINPIYTRVADNPLPPLLFFNAFLTSTLNEFS